MEQYTERGYIFYRMSSIFNFDISKKYLVWFTTIVTVITIILNATSFFVVFDSAMSTQRTYSTGKIDDIIENINQKIIYNRKFASQIYLDAPIQAVCNLQTDDFSELIKRLTFYKNSDYYLESIYLYNENDNKVYIDGRNKKFDLDQFDIDITLPEVIEKAEYKKIVLREKNDRMVYTMVIQPYQSSQSKIILNYYPEYLRITGDDNSSYYVLDEHNQILATSKKQSNNIVSSEFIEAIGDRENCMIGGNMVSCRKSDGMTFLSITRYTSFLTKTKAVLIFAIVSCLIMIAFVFFSFLGLTKWILQKLSRFHTYTNYIQNESSFLEKQTKKYKLQDYIRNSGSWSEGVKNKWKNQEQFIYLILIDGIDSNSRPAKENNAINYAIINVMEELAQNNGFECDVIKMSLDKIAVLSPESDGNEIYQCILKTKEIIKEILNIDFSVIKSDICVPFDDIPLLYSQLENYAEWLFYYDSGALLDLADYRSNQLPAEYNAESEIEEMLKVIRSDMPIECIHKLNEKKGVFSPQNMKAFIREMLICLEEEYLKTHIDNNFKVRIKSLAESVNKASKWVEAENEIVVFLKYFQDLTQENSNSYENAIVEKVRTLIRKKYSEIELTREFLAESVHLSVKTTDKLFKKYQGCSMASYLHHYRLERAAELLRETNFSVKSISEKVGYASTSHFIQNFKKMYGVTPEKFRQTI